MKYVVSRYLFGGVQCQTQFWWTKRVRKEIGALDSSRRNLLMKRLSKYAGNGFRNYQGQRGEPIKLERNGVYRIGESNDLFRIIGFYEDNTGSDFYAIDAFRKRGQSLTTSQERRVSEVVRVRLQGDWEKCND